MKLISAHEALHEVGEVCVVVLDDLARLYDKDDVYAASTVVRGDGCGT